MSNIVSNKKIERLNMRFQKDQDKIREGVKNLLDSLVNSDDSDKVGEHLDNLAKLNKRPNGESSLEEDKPSDVSRYSDGRIFGEEYRSQEGKLHREGDKPALILYYPNGQVYCESWYQNGKRHREGDKPAERYYYPNGQVSHEKYYKNGKLFKRYYYDFYDDDELIEEESLSDK